MSDLRVAVVGGHATVVSQNDGAARKEVAPPPTIAAQKVAIDAADDVAPEDESESSERSDDIDSDDTDDVDDMIVQRFGQIPAASFSLLLWYEIPKLSGVIHTPEPRPARRT